MLGLLKSDLYRVLNPKRLHGEFFGCAVALVILIAGTLGFTSFMLHQATTSSGLVAPQDIAELSEELHVALGTPSSFLGSILIEGSMLGIITMLGVVLVACADMRDGFAKTLMQGGGREAYYREKIVFNGIWAAMVLVAGFIIAIVFAAVLGFPLSLDEDPARFLAWLALCWLGLWTLSLLALATACATRRVGAVYFIIIFVGAGAVSGFFKILVEICEVLSEFNLGAASMHSAIKAFSELLPTNLMNRLAGGSNVLFQASSIPGASLPGGFALQALLGFGMVAALSIAFILFKGPKREF